MKKLHLTYSNYITNAYALFDRR